MRGCGVEHSLHGGAIVEVFGDRREFSRQLMQQWPDLISVRRPAPSPTTFISADETTCGR
jgi:hypothetical protein